jgi:hypothetical protein
MRVWTLGGTAVVVGALMALGSPAEAHTQTSLHKPVATKASHIASASHAVVHGASHASHGANAVHSVALRIGARNHAAEAVERRGGFSHAAIRSIAFRPDAGAHFRFKHPLGKSDKALYSGSYGGISCVPFARAASGIDLKGNAYEWWDAASGVYARGDRPESGSVMNFRANGHMRLGHVAVVTAVLNSRMVEIDHANWAGPGANRGGVSRGVPVIDVSEANDWTAVRVGLGRSGEFGSVYPTYGFIYDRPDTGGITMARAGGNIADDEVAEAPVVHARTRRAVRHSLR